MLGRGPGVRARHWNVSQPFYSMTDGVSFQVRGHVHKMLGDWLAEFTDLRTRLVRPPWPSHDGLRALTAELRARIIATGRSVAVPAPSDRKRAAAEKVAAISAAQAEQAREDGALRELECKVRLHIWMFRKTAHATPCSLG